MLGKRDPQRKLFSATTQLGDAAIAKMGFYGKLALQGRTLFRDEDFAPAYCADKGRPSAPPSLLALARLLQYHDAIADAEVVARCRFDLRWKVALELDLASIEAPFAKSTFQAFRARLTLHAQEGLAFEKSVKAAKEAGLLPRRLTVALDSSPLRGHGAIKDTFNLLSDAIVAVVRAVAAEKEEDVVDVACAAGLERHVLSDSIKGSEVVNWEDDTEVSRFLAGLLADSRRAVDLAEQAKCGTQEVELLRKVIDQDVETKPETGEPRIRDGVAPDRVVSVHDPDMRHGHKSNGKVYNGHKAHVAVDTDHGIITALDVTAPAEPDGGQVAELIKQTNELTGCTVERAIGDTAYSSRTAIDQARESKAELVSKMASPREGAFGPKDFKVSDDGLTATCPAGLPSQRCSHRADSIVHFWAPVACAACAFKSKCTKAPRRSLQVAPDFHDRRRRECFASSGEGRQILRTRVAAEHAIGRLKNLGAGVARAFGRAKTKAQLLWTAAVANLSRLWGAQSAAQA